MKIKNIGVNALLYLLYMVGSCFVTMLAESLFMYIVTRFYIPPFPAQTIIRLVIYTAGVVAILAGIGYFEGYREGNAAVGETVAGGVMAVILHALFALLFHFQAFVAGGVRFAAGLIGHGMSVTPDRLNKETSIQLFILLFFVYALLYVGSITVSRYLGAQKRLVSRAELRRGEAPDADRSAV